MRAALTRHFEALSSPAFRLFWFGSMASIFAAQLAQFAMGWSMFELSQSPALLGALGAALSIPTILFSLAGGLLADRVDRRLLLIATSVISALMFGTLAVLDATGVIAVWHLLLAAIAIGVVWGLDWPVRVALYPSLVARTHMSSAVALNSMLWQGGRMAMPALAGYLIAASGTYSLFALACVGNIYMYAVLVARNELRTALPAPEAKTREPAQNALADLRQAFVYILRNRLFRTLIGMSYAVTFFGSSLQQQMPAFADLLGSDETATAC